MPSDRSFCKPFSIIPVTLWTISFYHRKWTFPVNVNYLKRKKNSIQIIIFFVCFKMREMLKMWFQNQCRNSNNFFRAIWRFAFNLNASSRLLTLHFPYCNLWTSYFIKKNGSIIYWNFLFKLNDHWIRPKAFSIAFCFTPQFNALNDNKNDELHLSIDTRINHQFQ